eukprot:251162_1
MNMISWEEYAVIKRTCDTINNFLPNEISFDATEQLLFNKLCQTISEEHPMNFTEANVDQKECNAFVSVHPPTITYGTYSASENIPRFEHEFAAAHAFQYGYLVDVSEKRLRIIQRLQQQISTLTTRCHTYFMQSMLCQSENLALRRILVLLGSNEESDDENQ